MSLTVKAAAYRPPGARGQPSSGSKFHVFEPPSNQKPVAGAAANEPPLSKNQKRRRAKVSHSCSLIDFPNFSFMTFSTTRQRQRLLVVQMGPHWIVQLLNQLPPIVSHLLNSQPRIHPLQPPELLLMGYLCR